MTIFNKDIVDPVVVAHKRCVQMKSQCMINYSNILRTYENSLITFWNSPQITPQQLCTAFGRDGKELFEYWEHTRNWLLAVNPHVQVTQASDYGRWKINDDGTVTIILETEDDN